MPNLEPMEFFLLSVPIILVVLLGVGLYWLIRKAVRDGHQDAQP
jgi:hypothetical protein